MPGFVDDVTAYRLHDVLESVETDVSWYIADLSIKSHRQALHRRREDQGPLATDERQLHGEQAKDRSNDPREVDDHILPVSLLCRIAEIDVESQEY